MINIMDYSRIIIVGSGGSGKSWLGKQLAKVTGYPLFHLDTEHWKPGWVQSSKEEKIARQNEIISGDKWIIDGNYGSTMEIRFAAAELVIFLDLSRIICAISVIRRHGKKRPDLPDYLEESGIFSKDSREFFKWVWSYPKTGRKTVMALKEKYPDKAFLQIKTRREVRKLLKAWGEARK